MDVWRASMLNRNRQNKGRQFLIASSLVIILAGCTHHPLSAKQLSLTPCINSNEPNKPLVKNDNAFSIQNFEIDAKYKF